MNEEKLVINGITYVKEKTEESHYSDTQYEYLNGDGNWIRVSKIGYPRLEEYFTEIEEIDYNWKGKYRYFLAKTKGYRFKSILRTLG